MIYWNESGYFMLSYCKKPSRLGRLLGISVWKDLLYLISSEGEFRLQIDCKSALGLWNLKVDKQLRFVNCVALVLLEWEPLDWLRCISCT